MIKVEEIQQYGTSLQSSVQAIASAYGDYTRKSFDDTRSFVDRLSGVKSIDKALEVQTEYAKSAYETFVTESQKIAGLYTDLAKQTFRPLENIATKFTASRRLIARGHSKQKPGRDGRAFSYRGLVWKLLCDAECAERRSDRGEGRGDLA